MENNAINFFAKTNFRNQERIFGIKEDDRRRHMYIIGKTGMGKSTLEENMAIQDIRNGKGVCVVDPHGEFAEKMLRAVPSNRVNDVIYFNPADSEFPIAFNILEAVDEDKKSLVALGMMGVFKKIWPDVWSARMEHILNNTILALLDYPGSTMLGVNRMMFDKDYRKRVYTKIKDPMVKSFWINEFDKWEDRFRKEAVAAIQNKVGQFLSSPIIRHIVGQPKSTIDMRDIMDNEKILIVNLSKGRIGEDAMRLLGGMVVTKLQLAAMGRVEMKEEERKDFYLYVDEFQNFATESFANILSEARKYRLCLTLAHQYIRQLIFDNNTTVRDAIFGNVGTMITFRIGAEDAEFMEKEFEPIFMMNDLVNLTKYQVYLKLMIDGIAGDAFSAMALPPIELTDTQANAEKVIRVSRERYGRKRADIEEKIARWSGMLPPENVQIVTREEQQEMTTIENSRDKFSSPAPVVKAPVITTPRPAVPVSSAPAPAPAKPTVKMKAERTVTQERVMYEAVCDSCEDKILVPFKPDPNRPAFCKECLKDYQRARERARLEQMNHNSVKKNYPPKSVSDNSDATEPSQEANRGNVVAFTSDDKPLALSQLDHMMPKKFQSRPKN
jgi:CxxC-x17-CxxC domain-containing protein